jgi:hypothetical protein
MMESKLHKHYSVLSILIFVLVPEWSGFDILGDG